MTTENLAQWANDSEALHARAARLFARSEPREKAIKCLRTLMGQVDRKNCWQRAEVVGDQPPDAMQRLLYEARWDPDAARDRLPEFVMETFGDEDGVGVVDEAGFLRKGDRSVGVKRQYCRTAGKAENRQVATVLSCATRHGDIFLGRRLYPREESCTDQELGA